MAPKEEIELIFHKLLACIQSRKFDQQCTPEIRSGDVSVETKSRLETLKRRNFRIERDLLELKLSDSVRFVRLFLRLPKEQTKLYREPAMPHLRFIRFPLKRSKLY